MNELSNYKPINLCSCLGKVQEKVVIGQLNACLHDNDLLHKAQHGLTFRRSTLNSMHVTDAHIAQLASLGHAVDIISFDFAKTYNKSSYHAIIKVIASHGMSGAALR